ncbi:hypothetical protein, conserved [Plasmodium gonderi]|uniref:Uncharacterized protein n=1 Tax=Plasmodium gonderi TaxID=77519 RepID=A0A1Y1JQD1_PLAGO|nr:hypothetical protein, conserved [Plasmodium gonderi]GAW83695.1 hypothetical protein, conserved [Plasmodium gonderi]
MMNEKYENLQRYNLQLEKKDIVRKGKKKKNDLRNILYFPSLFWFNGQSSPFIPYFTYNEEELGMRAKKCAKYERKKNVFNFKIIDFLTCSVHKNSIIIKKIIKNEVLNVSMFSDMKVLSCLFYISIDYVLRPVFFLSSITRKPFFFCLSLSNLGEQVDEMEEKADKKMEHEKVTECEVDNTTLVQIPHELILYNDKKEILLFDFEKNKSHVITREKTQITSLNFTFIYINENNSLYNKLSEDQLEGNIKIVDLDKIEEKIVLKNKYCFEIFQELLNDCALCYGKGVEFEMDISKEKKWMYKILQNMFYVLIYGDNDGNIYFLIPEKQIKIKKKLRKNEKIHLIETNVKAYFDVKNYYHIANAIRNNFYIFLACGDSIQVFNIYNYQVHFVIDISNEDILFSLSVGHDQLNHMYLAFSTQKYVKIVDITESAELHCLRVDRSDMEDSSVQPNPCRGGGETEKPQKNYTCVCFGKENTIYISNGDKKGFLNVYNLKEKKVINKYDTQCKRIFSLSVCIVNGEEYAYIYDAEKNFCLYQISKKRMVYKIFTISVWIHQILCFQNNIIFSLGNENVYNLVIKNNGEKLLTKPYYSDHLNVCTYLINHPYFPLVAFVNKKFQFGFFSLSHGQRKTIVIPSIRENRNVFSLCWFCTGKKFLPYDWDYTNDETEGENDHHTTGDLLTQFADGVGDYTSLSTDNCHYTFPLAQENVLKKEKHFGKNNTITMANGERATVSATIRSISTWSTNTVKHLHRINISDTYLVVLNEDTVYLYNIVTRQVSNLHNYLLSTMSQFNGRKKFLASTIWHNKCYVFIFAENNTLFIFDENFMFSVCIANVGGDRIVRFYVHDGFLLVHSNTSLYFASMNSAVSVFSQFSVNPTIDHTQNEASKKVNNESRNECQNHTVDKKLLKESIHFTKVSMRETFKITLFDFHYMENELYFAIFTKKKEILVYKVFILPEECKGEKVPADGYGCTKEAHLVAQFLNFYQFENINKVGSILCMKFFYNCAKQKMYLIFGGLEQFLFFWDFTKYPLVKRTKCAATQCAGRRMGNGGEGTVRENEKKKKHIDGYLLAQGGRSRADAIGTNTIGTNTIGTNTIGTNTIGTNTIGTNTIG